MKASWYNVQDGLNQSEMPYLSSVSYTFVELNQTIFTQGRVRSRTKDASCQKYFMIRISDHGFQFTASLIARKISQFITKPTRCRATTSVISSLLMAFLTQLVKKNHHIYWMRTEILESAIPGFAWNIAFIRGPVHWREMASVIDHGFILPENKLKNQNMAVEGLMDFVVF